MSDLISRQAVIDIIHKEIERTSTFSEHETQINIEMAVNELPVAYDIEKVVAELEYQKEYFEKDRTYWADHTWKDNVAYCNWDLSDKKVNCYESAIDIVRKGGVE